MTRYERNRNLSNQMKNMQGCAICGERNPVMLDWHHVRDKKFAISKWRGSIKRMLEEIDKCVCLCANHHRQLHAGEIALSPHDLKPKEDKE